MVRKKSSSVENITNNEPQEDQENSVSNNNAVINDMKFTGEQAGLPSQHREPSHEKNEASHEGHESEDIQKKPHSEQENDTKPIDQNQQTNEQNIPSQNPPETNQNQDLPQPVAQPQPVQQPTPQPKQIVTPADVEAWFARHNWDGDPFIFVIDPALLVGYVEQTNHLLRTIQEKHKLFLVVGPTGSGKTTMLKWVGKNLSNKFLPIFISKPPSTVNGFVEIFNEQFPKPWYRRAFESHIKNIYQIPEFLKAKSKGKHIVLMCDEIHEANPDVLEWLRVLTDSVDNMSLIVAGLPVFNEIVKEKLETFQKRIISHIELISLTKNETHEMIQKRVESVGGQGLGPFNQDVIEYIFNQTGGFPREVLRVSDDLLNLAIKLNVDTLTKEMIDQYYSPSGTPEYRPLPPAQESSGPEDAGALDEEPTEERTEQYRPMSLNILEDMTPLQMKILNILAEKETTPGEIANTFDLGKYKSRQHAVRSVNNILIRLMQEDFVRRNRRGRTFTYTLSPRIKTLLVRR